MILARPHDQAPAALSASFPTLGPDRSAVRRAPCMRRQHLRRRFRRWGRIGRLCDGRRACAGCAFGVVSGVGAGSVGCATGAVHAPAAPSAPFPALGPDRSVVRRAPCMRRLQANKRRQPDEEQRCRAPSSAPLLDMDLSGRLFVAGVQNRIIQRGHELRIPPEHALGHGALVLSLADISAGV